MADTMLVLRDDLIKVLLEWSKDPTLALPGVLKAAGAQDVWQRLATQIGALKLNRDPEVSLPLFKQGTTATSSRFGWNWSAQADAGAVLNLDVLTPDELEGKKIEPASSHHVVRYAAKFNVGASLDGQRQLGAWGQASASAGGSFAADLHWLVQAPDSRLLAAALVEALPFWKLPNDLEGLLKLADAPDFWGVVMQLQGTLSASFGLSAQAGFTGWTFGFAGEKVDVGVAVQGSLSVKGSATGLMTLTVTPERDEATGDFGLRVELLSKRDSTRSIAASVGAGLDLSALAKSAERAVRAGLPALDSPALDDLTLPGTAVQGKLQALLADKIGDPTLKQLASLLLGETDTSKVKDAVLARLSAPLADVLDKALGELASGQADTNALVDEWIRAFLGNTPVGASLKTTLTGLVNDAATLAGTNLGAALGALNGRLTAAAGGPLDAILKPLGALGEKINQALAGLDKSKFPTAIKDVVAGYNKKRNQLLAALGDASKAKIALEFALAVERSRSGQLAFSGWFSPKGDQSGAQRLYQALCTGRLTLLGDLIEAAGSVSKVSGWLEEAVKRTSTATVTLSLFGMDLVSSQTRLIDLTLRTDLWGNLVAADSALSASSAIANPWAQRMANIGIESSLVDKEGLKTIQIGLSGAYTVTGKETSRQLVQALADDYASCLQFGRALNVAQLLGAPDDANGGSAKAFWRNVTVALSLPIAPDGWVKFEACSDDTIRRAFLRHGLRCLQVSFNQTDPFRFDTPEARLRERTNDRLGSLGSDPQGRMLEYLGLFDDRVLLGSGSDYLNRVGFADVPRGDLEPTARRSPVGLLLFTFHRFAGVVRSGPALRQASGKLRDALSATGTGTTPAAIRGQIEPILRGMSLSLSAAAIASQTLTGLSFLGGRPQGITWPLTTFALAMGELTGSGMPIPVASAADASPLPLLTFV